MSYRIRVILLCFLMTGSAVAQNADSTSVSADKIALKAHRDSVRVQRKVFNQENTIYKPIIGLGAGVLNYFGEVNNNDRTNPLINNYGFQFSIIKNFTPSFGMRFDFNYGKLTANQRSEEHNLNFSSDLINFNLNATYNFAGILPPKRFLNPFISIGVGAVNFSTKGDLKDQNQLTYHFWKDGTVRSLAENDPLAESALVLKRDYTYETDLRKANLDSLGNYPQFAVTLPFTFGLNFRVSPRSIIRLSSTFSYAFTDLIDNVSDKSLGQRKGNAANDMFMFTAISYHFDFFSTKKKKKTAYDDTEFFSLEGDSDNDGVSDMTDRCPGTPAGGMVDKFGCPMDSDNDGVYDYLDQEPNSDSNLNVDGDGVGITDEMATASADTTATRHDQIFDVYPDMKDIYNQTQHETDESVSMPLDHAIFDNDGNGIISVDEVYQAIDIFFEGALDIDAKGITRLIDYFFDQ